MTLLQSLGVKSGLLFYGPGVSLQVCHKLSSDKVKSCWFSLSHKSQGCTQNCSSAGNQGQVLKS